MKIIRIIFLSALLMGFTGAVQAQQYWGALAFDINTGIAGGSSDASSRRGAEQGAMTSCVRKHGGKPNGCKVQTSFYNGCISAYWSPVNKKGGYAGSDYNIQQARTRGYKKCISNGGVRCQERLSFCTTLLIY